MPIPLPRKQTVLIFAVCTIAVVVTDVYATGFPSKNSSVSEQATIQNVIQSPANSPIVYSDDWKKSFYDVKSSTSTKISQKNTGPQYNDQTVTGKLGQDLFAGYIQLKQSGLSTNPDMIAGLTSDLLSKGYLSGDQAKIYEFKDIVINQSSDINSVKEYGNKIGSIISQYIPQKNDGYIALRGIQNQDPSYVAELEQNVLGYKKVISLLVQVPVPQSLAQNHLDLINGISSMMTIAQSLESAGKDPLKSMAGLSKYNDALNLVFNGLKGFKNMSDQMHISYISSEGGSIFTSNQ